MGFAYSTHSKRVLVTLHPILRAILTDALEIYDHRLERGLRDVAQQRVYVKDGWSKTMKSEHLPFEVEGEPDPVSRAVDAAPYPVDYDVEVTGTRKERITAAKNRARFAEFAGIVKAIGWYRYQVRIRWGGDWDGDNDLNDQTFDDLVHFELVPARTDSEFPDGVI